MSRRKSTRHDFGPPPGDTSGGREERKKKSLVSQRRQDLADLFTSRVFVYIRAWGRRQMQVADISALERANLPRALRTNRRPRAFELRNELERRAPALECIYLFRLKNSWINMPVH